MIAIRYLVAAIQGLTAVLMLIAVALNAANIAGRFCAVQSWCAFLFGLHPILSAEEIMLFLLVGTVFLGNAIVGFEGRQLRMDVIIHALPPGLRRACDLAADITTIAISVTLIMLGWPAVGMLAEFDQRSQAAEIPLAIPQALVPIGLGLTALLVGVRLIASLRKPSSIT